MCALEKFREKKEEEEGKIISSKKLRAKGFIFEDLRNLKKVEWMSNFILPLFIYFFLIFIYVMGIFGHLSFVRLLGKRCLDSRLARSLIV